MPAAGILRSVRGLGRMRTVGPPRIRSAYKRPGEAEAKPSLSGGKLKGWSQCPALSKIYLNSRPRQGFDRLFLCDPDTSQDSLPPVSTTWAAMLGRWIDFARSATALPTEGPQGLLRRSVSDIITLQAVWFALGHLDQLPADQRSLGLDRSQILIDRHAEALHARFDGQLPPALAELISDARHHLLEAQKRVDHQDGTDGPSTRRDG